MIQQRKAPAKRAFTGMAGSPLARVDDSITLPVLSSQPTTEELLAKFTKKRGRPAQGNRAMTPAERKAKQRANQVRKAEISKTEKEQKLDDESGGIFGPGHAAKGGGIAGALAIGEKHHHIDESENAEYIEAPGHRVTTNYRTDEDESVDIAEVPGDKTETKSTFQKRHRINKNWKYSKREKDEIIYELAINVISSSNMAEFVWDAGSKEFICVEPLRWCRTCHLIIPATHCCQICGCSFDWLSEAVRHVVDRHRRTLLRGVEQPARIPGVNKLVRAIHEANYSRQESQARAEGWIKRGTDWERQKTNI